MFSLSRWAGALAAACLSGVSLSSAQTNPAGPEKAASEPRLTPGALYRQAMHPLEIVRSSMDNWSDAETGAFRVGMGMAKQACEQAAPENYSGDDLYDLARLCSLGQDWNSANTAATRYLDSRAEPHRTQAFALSINALMHLFGSELAVETARSMMLNQPYDAEAAYAMRFLKDALEQMGNSAAIPLAEAEHPLVVKALEAGSELKAVHGDAVISLGALYESAMELAFWQRYRHKDAEALATIKDIEDAMAKATTPSGEDKHEIDAVRTEYALLGEPLPAFKTTPVERPPKSKGKAAAATQSAMQIGPDYGAATVLVLFPDWCPQCRKMMKTLTEFAKVNKDVYAYGLMFPEDPAPVGIPEEGQQAHEQNQKDVEGTSTLLVDGSTAQTLGVRDFPLGIVLDHGGRVRYIGVLPGDAFNSKGYMERVLAGMSGAQAGDSPAK